MEKRSHDVGEKVRVAREAASLSQERLAEIVGLSRNAVSNIEAAGAVPKADTLYRIAQATGKPLDWFFQDPARPLSLFPTLMAAAVEGLATMQPDSGPEVIAAAPDQADRMDRLEFLVERLDGRLERIEHALGDIAAELRHRGSEGGSACDAA